MRMKICAPTREIFLAHGRDEKVEWRGADGNPKLIRKMETEASTVRPEPLVKNH